MWRCSATAEPNRESRLLQTVRAALDGPPGSSRAPVVPPTALAEAERVPTAAGSQTDHDESDVVVAAAGDAQVVQ
nr:hypothetical protein [Streptomyces sp. GESEQ-4]